MFIYIIAAIIIWLTFRWIRSLQTVGNYGDRYVLITGCDTGFGNMLTKRLDGLGFHVFAGCLSERGIKELDDETTSNVVVVHLDVRQTKSIENAFEVVRSKLPHDKGLWGVVNNAGIVGRAGPCDWLSRDDFRQVLEVNTFGMIETTRVFLPLVIKSKGRIVNMISMLGRIAVKTSGPYSVSKFAAEGYSDVLRREMYRRGVTVHILEPGFFKTPLTSVESVTKTISMAFNNLNEEQQNYFGQSYITSLNKQWEADLHQLVNPKVHLVVDAYAHALTASYPKYRYVVGNDAKYYFRFLCYCPEWLSDFALCSKSLIPHAEQNVEINHEKIE